MKKSLISAIRVLACSMLLLAGAFWADAAVAQPFATTVQLPIVRVTRINTAVSVPDGGTINLSGGGRSIDGYRRQRYGGGNRSYGSGRGRTSSTLSARIIRLRELEEGMLRQHGAGFVPGHQPVPVNAAVAAKAAFITRHITRSR